MLQKLDMVIPVDVLGLSGVEIVDIYLRDKHELISAENYLLQTMKLSF